MCPPGQWPGPQRAPCPPITGTKATQHLCVARGWDKRETPKGRAAGEYIHQRALLQEPPLLGVPLRGRRPICSHILGGPRLPGLLLGLPEHVDLSRDTQGLRAVQYCRPPVPGPRTAAAISAHLTEGERAERGVTAACGEGLPRGWPASSSLTTSPRQGRTSRSRTAGRPGHAGHSAQPRPAGSDPPAQPAPGVPSGLRPR